MTTASPTAPATAAAPRHRVPRAAPALALALALALAGLALTACSSPDSTPPVPAGHTTVVFTPAQTLDDTQLQQAADLLSARAGRRGLKDVRTDIADGTVTVTVAGHVGDQLAPLGRRGAVDFRPVLALLPAGADVNAGAAAGAQGTVPADLLQQFDALSCAAQAPDPRVRRALSSASTPSVACGRDEEQGQRYKFALAPVAVKGADIATAESAYDRQSGGGWQVQLTFNSAGSAAFSATTAELATRPAPTNQFAIVLDGQVLSHPYVATAITGGAAVISGNFSEDDAKGLAASMGTGVLPAELTPADPRETDS
ncbi:SecDF P1 head subdomain-containing protein [Kitasatospora sp. NPDC088346]|uniref:SecDF P1 head subdomain-containing protein n=1 Tax=Kitasatospora sp. NPDC088346 TaxID=3364073 RepID=UPI00382E9906